MESLVKQERKVTFSRPPQQQQGSAGISPWIPQSGDGGDNNNLQRSWFQRQDDYYEYDPHQMEYSAAVAAAAFAISSSLQLESEADYRKKINVTTIKDENHVSMGRAKSKKEETPTSRMASFRTLSIKEDRDPGESSNRRLGNQDRSIHQQQQQEGSTRRPSLSSAIRREGGAPGEDSWEKAQLRKINKRYDKMESKIVAWEEAKKMQAKLKMERKRNELEMRRTRNVQHYQSKIERIDMIASGAKGQLKDKRRKEEAEVKQKARLNGNSKGRITSCFGCN